MDCGAKLLKEGGIRSIYKGTCATLLRGETFAKNLKLTSRVENMNYKIVLKVDELKFVRIHF